VIDASPEFIAALAYSHEALTRIEIDGTEVPMISGSESWDINRNVMHTGSMRIANEYGAADFITTASQVHIFRGVRFLDHSTEYVLTGIGTVQERTKSLQNPAISIQFADHGQYVEDFPLPATFSPSGMTYVQAIQALVEAALPYTPDWWVDPALPATSPPVDAIVNYNTARWSAIQQFAQPIGAMVGPLPSYEPNGIWCIWAVETGQSESVGEFVTGPSGVIIDSSRTASRRDVYNGVSVSWGASDAESGVELVTDSDPSSPTYWSGPWGKKTKSLDNTAITTQAAAITAGQAELAKVKGAQSGVDFQVVYNPLYLPGDVINVRLPDSSLERHVLDTINRGLTGGSMKAETRILGVA